MNVDPRDLLRLSTIPGIGSTRLINLISHFKDCSLVAKATGKELLHVAGIEKKTAHNILHFFREGGVEHSVPFIDDQLERAKKVKARIVTYWDREYPTNLKTIYDAPAFLFVRGEISDEDKYSIAIVGTRSASDYGAKIAEQFAAGFAILGVTTVSGLARGIDAIAHRATLKAEGRTIAVIGSGVDVIYPQENRELAMRVIERGAMVSEFEMGAKPDAVNFPRRNRIISGMSLGTLIVESGPEGGSMITASFAFEQDREVFAIPYPLNEKKKSGTNLLIKQDKAQLVESVEDIVEVLAIKLKPMLKTSPTKKKFSRPQLTLFEQKIFDAIGDAQIHVDALAKKAECSTSDALVQLLSLELKGAVRSHPGKMFSRLH